QVEVAAVPAAEGTGEHQRGDRGDADRGHGVERPGRPEPIETEPDADAGDGAGQRLGDEDRPLEEQRRLVLVLILRLVVPGLAGLAVLVVLGREAERGTRAA